MHVNESERNKVAITPSEIKTTVKEFWNRNVCHVNFIKEKQEGTHEFFEEAERIRYKYHYYLMPIFDRMAHEFPGGTLLEVGCGMGTDLLQLARRDLDVTGVDITDRGIYLARQRFELYNMNVRLEVEDAENLPYGDDSFDIFYSFGVLHHTPDTQKTIDEAYRVLKPGGLAIVMLYHRNSLNYVVHRILKAPFDGSKRDPCPVEKAYSRKEIQSLFHMFSQVKLNIEYLFGTGWGIANKLMPKFLHRILGKSIGWHILIEARK